MLSCLPHSHKHGKALNDALQLMQVVDDFQTAGADATPSLLPALKRRNSGKRNLHRPWTAVEEDELVRLVEQAEHRKQVTCIFAKFCSLLLWPLLRFWAAASAGPHHHHSKAQAMSSFVPSWHLLFFYFI